MERRLGLEQEFFLVDRTGRTSDRADEFLALCRGTAGREGLDPAAFVGECTGSMVEINTPPAYTVKELAGSYLASLSLALRAGRELGIRLYPLATYPLPLTPALRDEPSYELQALTIGRTRFLHAARCVGVHLHLELPAGTVDPDTIISPEAPAAAREELLNLYNLATALDPALVALTRASPFYEGRAPGLAVRTAFYRGSALLGYEGLYTRLPEVGDLRPYARNVEELIERQLAGYKVWLEAMDRSGVDWRLFFETGGNALKASWNPVRLNAHGTVELRSIDGNYPEVVLAAAALVHGAANRVRSEGLKVTPNEEVRAFSVSGDRLYVPGFEYLGRSLSYAAATEGVESHEVSAYLDSVFEFAAPDAPGQEYLAGLRLPGGFYRTTEAGILNENPLIIHVSIDEGLHLVREACDELEEQVFRAISDQQEHKLIADG
ncbi:MAG: glutamate-cysteine ligase family protein [Actinomycetota bacterium]|nr:glutamate-cysteine ligase family protein [Actinomycetota bacterium]